MYAKFVRPFLSGQDAFVVEAETFRYNKQFAESEDDYAASYPSQICLQAFDGDMSHVEEWPAEVVVLRVGSQLYVAPHCSLYVLNENGKTIDSVHCYKNPDVPIQVVFEEEKEKPKKAATCESRKDAEVTGEFEVAGVMARLCDACIVKESLSTGPVAESCTRETRIRDERQTPETLKLSDSYLFFRKILRGETDALLYHCGPEGIPTQASPGKIEPKCVHCGSADIGIVAVDKEDATQTMSFCVGCMKVLLPKKSCEMPQLND